MIQKLWRKEAWWEKAARAAWRQRRFGRCRAGRRGTRVLRRKRAKEKRPGCGRFWMGWLAEQHEALIKGHGIGDFLGGDALVVAVDQAAFFRREGHGGKAHARCLADAAIVPGIAALAIIRYGETHAPPASFAPMAVLMRCQPSPERIGSRARGSCRARR